MVSRDAPRAGVTAETAIALIHEEGGAFGISFPDFPGCVSGGGSIEEAIARGTETLAFHVAGMLEDGDPMPELRSLTELRRDRHFRQDSKGAILVGVPVEMPGKTVRINITLEDRLLSAVDRAASASGQSRSGFLAEAARRRIRGTG